LGPLETDRDQVTFHLRLEVQRVDVHMKLEDSSTLGCIFATALKVSEHRFSTIHHLCIRLLIVGITHPPSDGLNSSKITLTSPPTSE
jgi:hypothetical protein